MRVPAFLPHLLPLQPDLPAIRHGVGGGDIHQAGLLPVRPPPRSCMEAAKVPVPERVERWRDVGPNLLAYTRHHDTDLHLWSHEAGEVSQIEIVGAEVV